MNEQQAEALRAPFNATAVGKLPKLACRGCSESPQKVCDKHRKEKCRECGNYMSSAHVHLDYVGHAAVTDRLLKVDPAWSWEPLALDGNGLPLFTTDKAQMLPDEKIALWIKLTVSGVTRLGFGGGKNIKEAIGDALRNAAMRFGVALDLWSKEDLQPEESTGEPHEESRGNGNGNGRSEPPRPTGHEEQARLMAEKVVMKAAEDRKLESEVIDGLAAARSIEAIDCYVPTAKLLSTEAKKRLSPLFLGARARIKAQNAPRDEQGHDLTGDREPGVD